MSTPSQVNIHTTVWFSQKFYIVYRSDDGLDVGQTGNL